MRWFRVRSCRLSEDECVGDLVVIAHIESIILGEVDC